MENLDLKINGRFRLLRKIGKGGFGVVYEGIDCETQKNVAIKLEDARIAPSILAAEADIYKSLANSLGVPHVYWHGTECEYNAAVLELLGPSLEDLFNYCGRRFSPKTVLMLVDQLIPRIQVLHTKGVIHRDVKPENFLVGAGRRGNVVYVTDFGLAEMKVLQKIRVPEVPKPPAAKNYRLVGTARYASINGHLGAEQSPYDDLISLGYMLVYFLNGNLPWQGILTANIEERNHLILEQKRQIASASLCKGLPSEFAKYFDLLESSTRAEVPPYSKLRQMFGPYFALSDTNTTTCSTGPS